MATLYGTQTEKNLLAAFAGESQARNRYTYFAKVAEKEGYKQIEGIFLETADHEQSHAKMFFKQLDGGDLEILAKFPAGKIGTTVENLKAAAAGEHEEWQVIYINAAETAQKEGFPEIARLFKSIATVEKHHEKRFLKLLKNIESGHVFKKTETVLWKCRKCGFIHEGTEAVQRCPACNHPQSHFELWVENY